MKLSDAKLRTLKEVGRHFDGAGLYLEITKAGGKYWRLKYRFAGKEKLLALGVYPEVSLRDARDKALAAKKTLDAGIDPSEQRKADKARLVHASANTFQAVATDWLTHQSSRWVSTTQTAIQGSLAVHIYPSFGNKPMSSIKPAEVMALVKRVEAAGAGEQAARLLQRIKSIYRWAVTHGRIEANPMIDLVPGEILKPREATPRAALPEKELPEFFSKLANYGGQPTVTAALRFLMLTAARPGEITGAVWAEIDLEAASWVIPAERMKMRTEHRVPLSKQSIALLQELKTTSGESTLVFPSPWSNSRNISENTLNGALARMGYKGIATAHGFRALFSTVANEAQWDADVIEKQLAHIERNKVRAAYHRASYTAERAKLMQWWADYLDAKAQGAAVIPIGRKSA
jgi:integrase